MGFQIENHVLVRYTEEPGVTEISIPKGIREIDADAFWNCIHLQKIQLPDTIRKIGKNAFTGCICLEEIRIPEGVTRIEKWTFSGCESLKTVIFPESLEVIGEYVFGFCMGNGSKNMKDYYHCDSLTQLRIPPHVRRIESNAFRSCGNLKEIFLPASVSEIDIDNGIFHNCRALEKIEVEEENVFYASYDGALYDKWLDCLLWCPGGKKSIIIPDSVTSMKEFNKTYHAFSDCKRLHITYCGITFPYLPEVLHFKAIQEFIHTKPDPNELTPNLSIHLKQRIMLGMFLQNPDDDKLEHYLKQEFMPMFFWLAVNDELDFIQKILDTGRVITAENIPACIDYALRYQKHELYVMLVNYKYKHLEFDDSEEDIRKKFEL